MSAISLRLRLLLAAAITIIAVAGLTLLVTRIILIGMVTSSLETRMDEQIAQIERALTADGTLDEAGLLLLPHFQNAPLQWGWRAEGPAGSWQGGAAIATARFPIPATVGPAVSGEGAFAGNIAAHFRRKQVALGNERVTIIVGAPQQLLTEPMEAVTRPIFMALGLLVLVMLAGAFLQLQYSLRPIDRLRGDIARIREGRAEVLSTEQPKELAPLAEELNALIRQNNTGLELARHHVANLAHGMKTPLATLTLRLAREGASAESLELVNELVQRIDHHLRRARSAAVLVGERVRADPAQVAERLLTAMRHLHNPRGLEFSLAVEPGLMAAVDAEDLDEMLGNLLDNACRHARGRVTLTVQRDGARAVLEVSDDGTGIPDDALASALAYGKRLDESGQGYGFGLAITRELAELYGGALELARADGLGGLSARLILPATIR